MKRLQIYIEEDMDEVLAVEAARLGTSKAALIRQFLAEKLPRSAGSGDPLDEVVGWAGDLEPSDDIDEVVYGS